MVKKKISSEKVVKQEKKKVVKAGKPLEENNFAVSEGNHSVNDLKKQNFTTRPKIIAKNTYILITTCVVLFVVAIMSFFYNSDSTENTIKLSTESEIQNIIASVREVAMLPSEMPAVALIEDPSLLGEELFYKESKKGDYVMLFKEKALLYDPINKKIKLIVPLASSTTEQ